MLAIFLIFSGCAKQEQLAPTPEQASVPVVKVDTTPQWVSNPDYQGYTGAVGYAKKQGNVKQQKRIALITAKAALSERLKINLEDMNTMYASDKDNTQNFHNRSRQTSSNHIHHVIIKDEFTDSDGVLYVWLIQQ